MAELILLPIDAQRKDCGRRWMYNANAGVVNNEYGCGEVLIVLSGNECKTVVYNDGFILIWVDHGSII